MGGGGDGGGDGILSSPRLNIFTVGNTGVMTCLGQGGLRSLSASNYISLYKDTVWKNRGLTQLRDINEQAVINSLDSIFTFLHNTYT